MTSRMVLVTACLLAGAWPSAAQDNHAGHQASAPGATAQAAPARRANLPAGEEQSKATLESSPRHGEYVDVPMSGGPALRSWIVYPERKEKAPVVIVIHEIFGLSDWIRAVADQLARDGFIAIAPDLITGKGPDGGGTESVSSRDDVVKLIRGLSPEEVRTRLDAVHAYAVKLPAANGKTATIGYCWGGAASFRYATEQPELDAAVVYYGSAPDAAALASIEAPVLGLYGSDDARVNATIEPAAAEMKKLGKTYATEIYEGAGHGFLRAQGGREGANMKATEQAWPRTIEFLRKHLN
jgi:carboxymethylenebutenolidase